MKLTGIVSSVNGGGKAAAYVTAIITAIVAILSVIGAMFYTAFTTTANSKDIVAIHILNDTLMVSIKDLQIRQTSLEVAMKEIETQFCAQDIIRNLMHANDQRVQAVLWHKTFPEETMPTDNAYYPMICNRKN